MKTASWTRWIIFVLFAFTAIAQTTKSADKKQNESGVKILSFGFAPKTASRLELVAVPNNTSIVPTSTSAYGAEYGREPNKNSQYYQYEKRTERIPYATLRLKNEGTKAIDSVVWEFTDPHFKGDQETGYSEKKSKIKIAPGQSAVLAERVPEHSNCGSQIAFKQGVHSMALICGRVNRRTTKSYPVDAKIKQVNYEDGTVWKVQ
jgi:hypothetical protein